MAQVFYDDFEGTTEPIPGWSTSTGTTWTVVTDSADPTNHVWQEASNNPITTKYASITGNLVPRLYSEFSAKVRVDSMTSDNANPNNVYLGAGLDSFGYTIRLARQAGYYQLVFLGFDQNNNPMYAQNSDWVVGQYYNMKIRIFNGAGYGKCWLNGTMEPDGWYLLSNQGFAASNFQTKPSLVLGPVYPTLVCNGSFDNVDLETIDTYWHDQDPWVIDDTIQYPPQDGNVNTPYFWTSFTAPGLIWTYTDECTAWDYAYYIGNSNPYGHGTATWTYHNVPSGSYAAYATWPENPTIQGNNQYFQVAGDAPFSIYNNGVLLSTQRVNQSNFPPNKLADVGHWYKDKRWYYLGSYNMQSGIVMMTLNTDANGVVLADAVRLTSSCFCDDQPWWFDTFASGIDVCHWTNYWNTTWSTGNGILSSNPLLNLPGVYEGKMLLWNPPFPDNIDIVSKVRVNSWNSGNGMVGVSLESDRYNGGGVDFGFYNPDSGWIAFNDFSIGSASPPINYSWSTGVWYWLRFNAIYGPNNSLHNSGVYSAKIWQDGTPQPMNWQYMYNFPRGPAWGNSSHDGRMPGLTVSANATASFTNTQIDVGSGQACINLFIGGWIPPNITGSIPLFEHGYDIASGNILPLVIPYADIPDNSSIPLFEWGRAPFSSVPTFPLFEQGPRFTGDPFLKLYIRPPIVQSASHPYIPLFTFAGSSNIRNNIPLSISGMPHEVDAEISLFIGGSGFFTTSAGTELFIGGEPYHNASNIPLVVNNTQSGVESSIPFYLFNDYTYNIDNSLSLVIWRDDYIQESLPLVIGNASPATTVSSVPLSIPSAVVPSSINNNIPLVITKPISIAENSGGPLYISGY